MSSDARGRRAQAAGTDPGRMPRKWRPSLRTILVLLNVTVLLLPVAGLVFFRIFEAHLVRETENELIVQGALVSAMFRARAAATGADLSRAGGPADAEPGATRDAYYRPVAPVTDLGRSEILPRRPEPVPTETRADPLALRIGDELAAMLTEAQRTTLSGLRLLDHQGIVVAGTAPPPRVSASGDAAAAPGTLPAGDIGRSFADLPEVARARTGIYSAVLRLRVSAKPQPAFASISRGARVRVFVVFPIVEGQRVLGLAYLSRTPDNILHKLYLSRDRVLWASALTLALALALAALTSRFLGRPIRALGQRTRQLAGGDVAGAAPLRQAGTRELAELSDSFTVMADALHRRATYVRDFAAHVSHELKTPLTSIRGAVELLDEHGTGMGDADRKRFLANIAEDADRLQRLVERLHELSRAEHAATVLETIELGDALREVRDRHATASLAVDVEAIPAAHVRLSHESLGIVAANLVTNAAQHGARHLQIRLEVAPGEAVVTFADDGAGIAPEHAARVFEAFFTTRQARGGTGLGLRIVRSVLEAAGGTIVLVPSETGATFRMRVPLVR